MRGQARAPGALALLAPDADAAGHDDLLDVGGSARVKGDDGGALVGFDVRLAPLIVLGQGGRAQDVQDAGGDAETGLLAEVGRLGVLRR